MVFLQETKLEEFNNWVFNHLWPFDGGEWEWSPAQGASGGLLILWDRKVFGKILSFVEKYMIGIKGIWKIFGVECYVVNVYAPCCAARKKKLWSDIHNWRLDLWGIWCIAGDFNIVRNSSERKGCSEIGNGVKEFNEFIHKGELIDLSLLNRKFTWFRSGVKRSRLDRFLVNMDWLLKFQNLTQSCLKRNRSDHCPLVLASDSVDWGPRPFKFLNCWFEHNDFGKVIAEKWRSFQAMGSPSDMFRVKLRKLKGFIKQWNLDVFGNVESKIGELESQLEELEVGGDYRDLNGEELDKMKSLTQELWVAQNHKESIWRQKSRDRWIREGYRNTKYFHLKAKARVRRNHLGSLKIGGTWEMDPKKIKAEVREYFQNIFESDH
ncbi:hypothetical protein REPUB_Repub15cG0071800 [Reevesia pubescens]